MQRAAEQSSIAVFSVRGGRIADPFFLRFAELASQPRSAEQVLRDELERPAVEGAETSEDPAVGSDRAAGLIEMEDHLALLARWFYGRPRKGEIFFPEGQDGAWPYRRILRACARVLANVDPDVSKDIG